MVLKIKNLSKSFKEKQVLKDINFEVNEGEILAIIGPSGAGKTTLLRCVNGLEKCDSGTIEIDGLFLCEEDNKRSVYPSAKKVREARKKLGMVFQNFNLFPHRSALENVIEAPVSVLGISKKDAEEKALIILSELGLKERANAYPFQLSGGEKQRVAIGRACALNPKLMCFDEPTSALDPELSESIASNIENLAKRNMAILIITHDMGLAKRVADRIIFMEKGKIIKEDIKNNFFSDLEDERINKFIHN